LIARLKIEDCGIEEYFDLERGRGDHRGGVRARDAELADFDEYADVASRHSDLHHPAFLKN